jgi:hypothetical protein
MQEFARKCHKIWPFEKTVCLADVGAVLFGTFWYWFPEKMGSLGQCEVLRGLLARKKTSLRGGVSTGFFGAFWGYLGSVSGKNNCGPLVVSKCNKCNQNNFFGRSHSVQRNIGSP